MTNPQETLQIKYYSGYLRNWKSLCAQLGIALPLSREEREAAILKLAYARWKTEMMDHLYGAFVFALWDEAEHTLFCARDQVGQKHLFYTVAGDELLCSGDLNEIAADPRVEKRLNRRMLQQYLFYGYPIGEETFYEGVYKLLPGRCLTWNGKTLTVTRYWKPVFEPDPSRTAEDWAEEIRQTVEEIFTEEREDPELPYKESFLSGGVDSSYLLAAGDPACANTVGYDEPGFDESELAGRTAALLGKGFRVKKIGPEEYFARIPQVIAGMGQPLGDASAVAFSLGCEAVAQHAKVVYSGEGIDEFFAGYNAHKPRLREDLPYLTCSHIMSEEVVRQLLPDYDEDVHALDPVAPLWQEVQGLDPLSQKLTIDISLWLEGDIYLNTDRTSQACGIELHTPFSDRRLFDVARRIPAEYKLPPEQQNKYVFRLAASDKLPEEIAFRKKVGFAVPIRKWMADPRYNAPVRDKLFGWTSRRFFHQDALREIWDSYLAGEDFLWSRLYTIYAFLLWADLHLF